MDRPNSAIDSLTGQPVLAGFDGGPHPAARGSGFLLYLPRPHRSEQRTVVVLCEPAAARSCRYMNRGKKGASEFASSRLMQERLFSRR